MYFFISSYDIDRASTFALLLEWLKRIDRVHLIRLHVKPDTILFIFNII